MAKKYQQPTHKDIDRFMRSYETDFYKNTIDSGIFDLSKNNIAREFFTHQLKHKRVLFGIKYKVVTRNAKLFDQLVWKIVISGYEKVVVFDVSDKFTPKEVDEFVKLLPKFRPIHVRGSEVVYGGLAMMKPLVRTVKRAVESGLFVLTEHNEQIKILNPKDFKPKPF